MFHTSDALTIGYADIFYMRNLQIQVLNLAKEITKNIHLKNAEIGLLNMYLCRSYIQRSIKYKNGIHANGIALAENLISRIAFE